MNRVEFEQFDQWWTEVALPRANYFIDAHLEEYPDYTVDDVEDYTDFGCVHRMVHEGEVEGMLWETCQEVYQKGFYGEPWSMDMSYSLFCELDEIIEQSYEAGERASKQLDN